MNGKEFESSVQETSLKPLNPVTLEPLKEDWRWVKLGEVIQEALPGFACGKRAGSDGFIQLRMNNISSHGQIDLSSILRVPATQEQVKKYRLVPGDVIFNNTNSVELVGKTALFNESEGIFLYSNHLTRLRSVPKILDTNYLASWLQLQWYQRVFEITCNRWIGQAAVQREKLLDFKIPLPPLLEQKRIATKVQKLMEEVGRARAACEKQLEAAKTLPAAHLREVFESEEAKKWERKRLGEVVSFIKNGIVAEQNFNEKGFPVTRIETISNGTIDSEKIGWVNLPLGDFADFKLFKGDILFSHINSVERLGNCAIYEGIPENLYHGMNLLRIKADESILDPYFLLYWLRSDPCKDYFVINARRAIGQASLNQEDIKQIPIRLPTLPVQQSICAELKEKMAEARNLQSAIQNQQSALNALPQAILRKAFRGEL